MRTIFKRVGLLDNIKVIDDRHSQTSRRIQQDLFVESFVFVIMVQAEFCPMNCPLSTPSQVNCPCQMSSDEFKNHLRNIKYFLQKGNLGLRSNPCIIQQSNFVRVQQRGMPSALHRECEIAFNFVNDISRILIA